MENRRILAIVALVGLASAVPAGSIARAQEAIGSTTTVQNQVTRELQGASAPLSTGESVFRNEAVKTGSDSVAKLVFVDSTNLAVGPTSRVVLDKFVYAGQVNGQTMAVNLAKGIFRFTTGSLDKKAYTISTPTAAIGVRHCARHRCTQRAEPRHTRGRPGDRLSAQERGYARAAGAELWPGGWPQNRPM
jgi:hypothetical protein